MKRTHRMSAIAVAGAAALAMAPTLAYAGVSPESSELELYPGDSTMITKTVTTPEIVPNPDIVMLVDSTGSMFSEIAAVQADMASIVTTVTAAQPGALFAVADYKDFPLEDDPFPDPYAFRVVSDIPDGNVAAQAAIASLTAGGGGDTPESQLNALWEIGNGAIAFRPDSSRIVVWFGDQPGHDPSGGHSQADAIAALDSVDAQVLAISVGADQLDAYGQATDITSATDGVFYSGVTAEELSAAILEGLSALPATVTHDSVCDPGLSVSFDADSRMVTSGESAEFEETVTVAADAMPGSTLSCHTDFMVNGAEDVDGYTQTVTVTVLEFSVACAPGPNPSGQVPPDWAESGFFELATVGGVDAVSVMIADTGSDFEVGPYPGGTTIKLTQAPGATPQEKPGKGAVDYQLRFKGDAMVTAMDEGGHTATAICTVPPNE